MRTPSPLLIIAVAILCGSGIDAAVKLISQNTPVLTLIGWRFLFGGVYCLILYIMAGKPWPKGEAIRFHFMRGIFQVCAIGAYFWSLTQLALAEATVIGFTAALMLAPIARIILGEKISAVTVIAALIGFAGAVFAVSGETVGAPADGNRMMGIAACLMAAFFYALTLVLMRLRTRKEDALTIVTFTNVIPAILMLPVLLATDPVPVPEMLPIFALLGAAGVFVWWLMTLAYGRAEAQQLAPLEYTALIWAGLLGWAIFNEVPGWRLWVGAAVIIAACLYVAFASHARARSEARMPASDILE